MRLFPAVILYNNNNECLTSNPPIYQAYATKPCLWVPNFWVGLVYNCQNNTHSSSCIHRSDPLLCKCLTSIIYGVTSHCLWRFQYFTWFWRSQYFPKADSYQSTGHMVDLFKIKILWSWRFELCFGNKMILNYIPFENQELNMMLILHKRSNCN